MSLGCGIAVFALFDKAVNGIAKYAVVAGYTIAKYLRDIYAIDAVPHLFGSREVAWRVS